MPIDGHNNHISKAPHQFSPNNLTSHEFNGTGSLNFAEIFSQNNNDLPDLNELSITPSNEYDQATFEYLVEGLHINTEAARQIASLVNHTLILERVDHLRSLGGDPSLHYMLLLQDPNTLRVQLSARFGFDYDINYNNTNAIPSKPLVNSEGSEAEKITADSDTWKMEFF